jgi:uncharacterized glyoxalase superfamily protein PhnB
MAFVSIVGGCHLLFYLSVMSPFSEIEFILFVADQAASRDFYAKVLDLSPVLDVPGMTEFQLSTNCKLGLMPKAGIARIICPAMPDPAENKGVPSCELYLRMEKAAEKFELAIANGAKLVSPFQARNWGHEVGYFADLDGNIVAFAKD